MDEMKRKRHKAPVANMANADRIPAGETGRYVRFMLIVSRGVAIIVFVAIALFVKAQAEPNP